MNNSNEYVDNLFIKTAIEELKKDCSRENGFNMMMQFSLRMRDNGTAPAPLMNSMHAVWSFSPDTELEDVFPDDFEPEKRNCLIVFDDRRWMPLFTDCDELGEFAETNVVEPMLIRDIIETAIDNEDIAGLIVNPFTDAFVFPKESLEYILDFLDEIDSEAC